MTNDELDESRKVEMGAYLEPHYQRLSSLLDILDIVEVEYGEGLYDEIASSSKGLKSILDKYGSNGSKNFWFERSSVATINHLSRAVSHMKEVIVNSYSQENS